MQESVYESFQRNAMSDTTRASSSNNSRLDHDHVSSEAERNSLTTASIELQLSRDEALARELQELENKLAGASLGGITGREAGKDSLQATLFLLKYLWELSCLYVVLVS